jgi:hypothetical protein
MMVSPTQLVPLTTIRDGKERSLQLGVMLQARRFERRESVLLGALGLSFEFSVHQKSLLVSKNHDDLPGPEGFNHSANITSMRQNIQSAFNSTPV